MPDPNDTFAKIKLLCDDVSRSKTRLGYDSELMRRVGTFVFGSLDAVRDAIQAPDGKSWRSAMFEEAAKRAPSEWQTMDTAPKDGTKILVVMRSHVAMAAWGGSRPPTWKVGSKYGPSLQFLPTHWMPLPSPPRTEGE